MKRNKMVVFECSINIVDKLLWPVNTFARWIPQHHVEKHDSESSTRVRAGNEIKEREKRLRNRKQSVGRRTARSSHLTLHVADRCCESLLTNTTILDSLRDTVAR